MRPIDPSSPRSEELILYGLLVLIGAIPVGVVLVQRAPFDVNATLGSLMICAGMIGVLASAAHALRGTAGIAGITDRHASGPSLGSRSR